MNNDAQKNASVSAPKLLRLGLQVRRVGQPDSQRYVIKDNLTGRQSILSQAQFFVLDQLSASETFEQLEERFQEKFSTSLSRQSLDETLELITRGKLWGRQAHSHPLVADKLPAQKPGHGKRIRRAEAQRRISRTNKRSGQISGPAIAQKEHGTAVEPIEDKQQAGVKESSAEETKPESSRSVGSGTTRESAPADSRPGSVSGAAATVAVPNPVAEGVPGRPLQRPAQGAQGAHAGRPMGGQQPALRGSIFPQRIFFDARPMLDFLLPLVSPFRKILLWSVPLLLLIAWFIIIKHTENFVQESERLLESLSFLVRLGVSLVTVNILSVICRALAARHFGMPVKGFGVRMVFWVIPRFMIAAQAKPSAPKAEQAWVHAMPLLAKLFLTGAGVLLWFLTRADDSGLSHFGFWLATMGITTFVLTAIPLFPASGYQLLALATDEPHLRAKALGSLKAVLSGKRLPEGGGVVLAVFGLSFILFMLLLFGVIFYMVGIASQKYFNTTGIAFFAGFLVFVVYRMYSRLKQKRQQREQQQLPANRPGAQSRGMRQRRPGQAQMANRGPGESRPKKPKSKSRPWLRLILAGIILLVMFLPYPYEAGGQLLIRPVDSQEIGTDFDGIIEEVFFDGGETLEPGVLLARLNSADAARQVNIHDARIKEQQAEIDRLRAKPTQEEMDLALEALRVEQTKAEYSRMNVLRKEKVFEKHVISEEEMESARREHEVNLGNVREAEANVALVEAGATQEEILAAEAELIRWEEERNLYQDQYDKSFLYMPIHGKLITQHLKQRIGQYLKKGEVFAVVENTSEVLGEIEVPEFDAGVIRLNADVRVRVWAYHDQIFSGTVTSIDTNVEERSFGNVVKVITLLENTDQRLKTGMTGYAKISGETRPVWEVLFMTIVRFVRVEMWSWIP